MSKARTNADNVSGDISGVTAGTGLSGGGTSGALTLNLSTPVASTNGGTGISSFTTGDLIYSSSGNTLSKLAIGTTSQVLTVASGLPSWSTASSGGMTLLDTKTADNTVTNYTFTSISGSYKHLLIIGQGLQSNSTADATFLVQLNGDTNSNYARQVLRATNTTVDSNYLSNATEIIITNGCMQRSTGTKYFGGFSMWIYDYANSSEYKFIQATNLGVNSNPAGFTGLTAATWDSTAAITSIKLTNNEGVNVKDGVIKLYGVS